MNVSDTLILIFNKETLEDIDSKTLTVNDEWN